VASTSEEKKNSTGGSKGIFGWELVEGSVKKKKESFPSQNSPFYDIKKG
jgi:hypothetical protein